MMGLILKQVFQFLKLLNSETGENQIAAGIACGFILGMSPFFSVQSLIILLVLFVFRIQIGAAFTSAFFFKFIAWLLDGIFDSVGRSVLESEGLRDLWAELYNLPIVPYTRFNNSIVMGAGLTGILLSPIIYLGSKWLIIKYRKSVVERFKNSKFWLSFKATAFYQWYAKCDDVYSAYHPR
jgi:uncharacterized protein (TIGR03546 family)